MKNIAGDSRRGYPERRMSFRFDSVFETEGAIMSHTSTAAKIKSLPHQATANRTVDNEVRRQMIATAAYFRSQNRRFNPPDPFLDWLAAEAEIDATLASSEEVNVRQ